MSEKCHSILALLSVAAIFGGCIFVGQRRFATMSPLKSALSSQQRFSSTESPALTLKPVSSSEFSWRKFVEDPANFPASAFQDPVCDAPGNAKPSCHEEAGVPSPRTPWSAYTREQLETWFDVQEKQSREAAAFAAKGTVDVVFLGDSIFESFRGTSYGNQECSSKRCKGVPNEFQRVFGKLRTVVLAISGDQVQHAHWRVITANHTGHVPGGGGFDHVRPKVVVVLIGTNNLGAGMNPAEIALGIFKLVKSVAVESRAMEIVFLPLLPRAHGGKPSSQARVAEVNRLTRTLLAPPIIGVEIKARVTLSECAKVLATGDTQTKPEPNWVANRTRMPDGLHPGAAGAVFWLECVSKEVGEAVARVH